MDRPCENCNKADNRDGYIKCDIPCKLARDCEESRRKLYGMLSIEQINALMTTAEDTMERRQPGTVGGGGMSKVIAVFDEPEYCELCPCSGEYDTNDYLL